jgi:predicted kinase
MEEAAMQAILLIGLPGSGKSSFYKDRFFQTHVRISRDLLKTPYRQQQLLELCLATDQRFVIDNTNPSRADRLPYIVAAKGKRFQVVGYYFESKVADCLERNARRSIADRVPEVAIFATAKKLELPAIDEGFDELYYVRLGENGFEVEVWRDDL